MEETKKSEKRKTITTEELSQLLLSNFGGSILDFRSSSDYSRCHLINSQHLIIDQQESTLKGKRDFWSNIRQRFIYQDFNENKKSLLVVFILPQLQSPSQLTLIEFLIQKLRAERFETVFLEKGAMTKMIDDYPDLCVFGQDTSTSTTESDTPTTVSTSNPTQRRCPFLQPLLKLKELKLSDADEDDECERRGTLTAKMNDRSGKENDPVNIYGTLYLGNAEHAKNLQLLKKYNINYILNVTSDLPNQFEFNGFKYLRIPVVDNVSQNLTTLFPTANDFIDEAVERKEGVLVHCLAGISRSVTFTVAYLMKSLNYSMEDAFDLVKRRKPNIEPNLNFMSQLLAYERLLSTSSRDQNRNQDSNPNKNDDGIGDSTPDSVASSLSASSASFVHVETMVGNGNGVGNLGRKE